ncbi:hypothetical protein N7519_004048 [Penicillium mononematosum]|uniref:uncharacterized protein n=1 Tax=Penicillium mononematosum TaxID=268346 RepID=UPI002548E1E5|nr:uncharacterized protein N7519_004048 [Penicillium mononematosum]KAJ6189140.1 hypothetical protein N7519_004048 [Penicillium mononematosum]
MRLKKFLAEESSLSNMHSTPGAPRPSRLTKWWPIGFFIGAIVCFIIGGALVGTWTSHAYDDCSYSSSYDSSSSYYSSYYSDYDYSCATTNMGEFYGAVAMFVIGGILKLVAWILLIIFCVKRSRKTYAAPQPYAPVPQPAPFPHSPASISGHPEVMGSSVPGTPPPNEANATAGGFKYCTQCGTAVSGRFCAQCGTQS